MCVLISSRSYYEIKPHQNLIRMFAKRRWLAYKPKGHDAFGAVIEDIIHLTPRGAIYLTKGENLNWDEEGNLGTHWTRSTADAINLLTPVKTTIKNKGDRRRALKMLAIGLARALEKKTDEPDEDFLANAREFVVARQLEVLQLSYFMTAVGTVFVITAILFLIATANVGLAREFVVAALLGGLGAIISVSLRFRSIAIERYTSDRFTFISGCSRIFFGCMFGAVFLLFQKARVVLSLADQQPFLLAAAAFVSGFSERAIPEVLEKFEGHVGRSKIADNGPGT